MDCAAVRDASNPKSAWLFIAFQLPLVCVMCSVMATGRLL